MLNGRDGSLLLHPENMVVDIAAVTQEVYPVEPVAAHPERPSPLPEKKPQHIPERGFYLGDPNLPTLDGVLVSDIKPPGHQASAAMFIDGDKKAPADRASHEGL